MTRGTLLSAAVASSLLISTGCASFHEQHYLRTADSKTGETVNYFRLTVTGRSGLASSRYVSGYYDERAVDLFFNEMRSGASGTSVTEPVFKGDQLDPGTEARITPLSPAEEHGVFVMIYSTNANAVADTIGQFAESQVVADSLTAMINRDAIEELRATEAESTIVSARANAVSAEIDGLVMALESANGDEATEEAALRLLRSLASALGGSGDFPDLGAAERWFHDYAARRI